MNLTSEHIWFSKTQCISRNTIMLLSAGTWSDFGTVMFFFVHFYFIFLKKKQTLFFMFLCRVTFWSLHCSTLRTLTWRRLARIMAFISFQMITYVLSHSLCGFFLMRPREKTIDNYSCEHQGSDSGWWHLRWVLLICKIFIVGLKSNKFINHI